MTKSTQRDDIYIKTKTIAEINGKEYDVLYVFQVAIPGWECDSTSYIVLIDGEPRLLNSDHGSFYVVSKDVSDMYSLDEGKTISIRDDVFELQSDIRRYQDLIEQNQTAINFLLPPTDDNLNEDKS